MDSLHFTGSLRIGFRKTFEEASTVPVPVVIRYHRYLIFFGEHKETNENLQANKIFILKRYLGTVPKCEFVYNLGIVIIADAYYHKK
jgi:hypothetical protein